MRYFELNYDPIGFESELVNWLCNETAEVKTGEVEPFEWQWFITMTSKDVMTKNGARLAITRFLGLYLQESKTDEVTCFWVIEPHKQGKKGWHIHALLQTKWPVPLERRKELNLALMLDDVYQRAMGLRVEFGTEKPTYIDQRGRITSKHRFRAERFTNTRAKYCAKYLRKEQRAEWEFARVRYNALAENEQGDLVCTKDLKGNWDKREARLRTNEAKRANELRKGLDVVRLKNLVNGYEQSRVRLVKFKAETRRIKMVLRAPSADLSTHVYW